MITHSLAYAIKCSLSGIISWISIEASLETVKKNPFFNLDCASLSSLIFLSWHLSFMWTWYSTNYLKSTRVATLKLANTGVHSRRSAATHSLIKFQAQFELISWKQCFQIKPSAVTSHGNFPICDTNFNSWPVNLGGYAPGPLVPTFHIPTSTLKSCENTVKTFLHTGGSCLIIQESLNFKQDFIKMVAEGRWFVTRMVNQNNSKGSLSVLYIVTNLNYTAIPMVKPQEWLWARTCFISAFLGKTNLKNFILFFSFFFFTHIHLTRWFKNRQYMWIIMSIVFFSPTRVIKIVSNE